MDITELLSKSEGPTRATVEVKGIKVTVREPSFGVYDRYGQLYQQGDIDSAVACLFKGCVIKADGTQALTDDQAMKLATSDKSLSQPIANRIFDLMAPAEKKADAPGAGDLPGGDSPGANAE